MTSIDQTPEHALLNQKDERPVTEWHRPQLQKICIERTLLNGGSPTDGGDGSSII